MGDHANPLESNDNCDILSNQSIIPDADPDTKEIIPETCNNANQSNTTCTKDTMTDSINDTCDNLIDQEAIREYHKKELAIKHKAMMDLYESYKRANEVLGYFSKLSDYTPKYEKFTTTVFSIRTELLTKYKDYLVVKHTTIFKQLLVSPTNTEWYRQGINKYIKIKNYSTFYYRRKIYVALESETIDVRGMRKIIEIVVYLDKYYDIYEDTIKYFMQTSDRFENLMRKNFSDYIYL